MKRSIRIIFFILISFSCVFATTQDRQLQALKEELTRAYRVLSNTQPVPAYFLQYELWQERELYLNSSLGAIFYDYDNHNAYVDIDIRVGSPGLDNTHEIRGSDDFDYMSWIPKTLAVPVDQDPDGIKALLWLETDRAFKDAQEKYTKILAERQVKVTETDTSPDFSPAPPVKYKEETKEINIDPESWRQRLNTLSMRFKMHSWIYGSAVSLRANSETRYIINTDGTIIKESRLAYRFSIYAATMADDGMDLYLSQSFIAFSPEKLPDEITIIAEIDTLIERLSALRSAPLVEPYIGPAILLNRASGVFFHEIFGHRIEGHRQKSEFEGQTFTKKVNEQILPDFISVYDDPTMKAFNNKDLNGYFRYDDEGVAAQKVVVVDHGILKNFLLSRSPIKNFPKSNGHGRREHGRSVVSRQGVLYIKSNKETSFDNLRQALIEECRTQNKAYGLIFYDISGGFTQTGRGGTQTFKVIPLFVKRVYVDGRPDEVVRGVDIVGTPLLSFSKIVMTGDDYDVFNGTCGAESGWVPVSAISPSIFVSEIEVEKKAKGQEKPPILPAPENQHNPGR